MKIQISVIVPVFSESRHIEKCIYSLTAQTFPPAEIIIVNDESTDNTKEKINNIRKLYKIKNIRIINQKHKGAGAARNLGANIAKGDILVFVDGDMYLADDFIEKITLPIIKGDSVATYSRDEKVANLNNVWSRCWNRLSGLPLGERIRADTPDLGWTFRAIKKTFFLKQGGFISKGYFDDNSLFRNFGKPLSLVADGAYCYHYNPDTLCDVFKSAQWIGFSSFYENFWYTFFRLSPIISLAKGVLKSLYFKERLYFIFQLCFDLGFFLGYLKVRNKKLLVNNVVSQIAFKK